jgi:isochorismate synthase EntC
LAEHEPIARGWYGAPIGWADANGGGAFMVAIRSLLVTPREAYAFAGAGIVQQSSAEDEWRETRQKMRAAKRALRVEVAP